MVAFLIMAFVLFVVTVELLAAVLPLLVVLAFVPPNERPALVEVMAATDGSRRLRLWSALRLVMARRGTEPR
jgi:hypothetical protein